MVVQVTVGNNQSEEQIMFLMNCEHAYKKEMEFTTDWETARDIFIKQDTESKTHSTDDIINYMVRIYEWQCEPIAVDLEVED